MAVDTSIIGTPTGSARVTIERQVLSNFANALKDENPIYRDGTAAAAAGFAGIPAPPTFSFAMEFSGKYPENQPEDTGAGVNTVLAGVIGPLMAKGGLVLHGEQGFEYHRPIVAGDVLVKEGRVADIYEKDTGSAIMTFVVTEEVWRDDRTGDPVLTSRMNLLVRNKKEA